MQPLQRACGARTAGEEPARLLAVMLRAHAWAPDAPQRPASIAPKGDPAAPALQQLEEILDEDGNVMLIARDMAGHTTANINGHSFEVQVDRQARARPGSQVGQDMGTNLMLGFPLYVCELEQAIHLFTQTDF